MSSCWIARVPKKLPRRFCRPSQLSLALRAPRMKMQLCAFLCELSRKFCVWLLLLGGWLPHPHDFETSNFHIPELFSSLFPEMHSRRAPAGFVRHDEGITLICSLLHLFNFEASYAPEKLKFHRNSQLFLARCLAMLALSLCAQREDITSFH